MIAVRCLGHIASAVGGTEVVLDLSEADPSEIVERLREKVKTGDPGFTRFNTLLMVQDGEALVPANSTVRVRDGDRVVLIPFSHGG